MSKFGLLGVIGGISQLIGLGQQIRGLAPTPSPTYQAPPIQETNPMEGFAVGDELEKHKYAKGSFYLGRIHIDHRANFEAGVADDRHIFIVAGTGAGKGRSLVIQNALRWRGGFVALDPKGELASITAIRRGNSESAKGTGTSVRKFIGQNVAILDPFGEVEGAARGQVRKYNPLLDIDIHSKGAQAYIKKLASAIIVPEEGKGAHFSDNAETILAGTIEAVLLTANKNEQTLPQVRQWLLKPFDELVCLLQDIDPEELLNEGQAPTKGGRIPDDGLAGEAVSILKDMIGSDEANSFKTTLSRNLKWISEPEAKQSLINNDFSLADLVKKGGSVYIVIPPNRMGDFKSWLRVIVQVCINAKIELGVNQKTIPTLFMLDEFPLLGRFKEIEESAGYLRGYNCKIACVIQNIGQIKQLYSKNWETFLGNAGAIIGFSTNDLETEQYLSDRMGKILAWETSYSTNSGSSGQALGGAGFSDGKGVSQAQRERAIRLPNEIHQQGARETMRAFVIPSGAPFMIERCNYDAIKADGLFDSPDYIKQWEAQYQGRI